MKKILLALTVVVALVTPTLAVDVLCGGSIPLVNNVIGVGTMTLDFSSTGAGVQAAYLIVNNNSQQFAVTITAANKGKFICNALVPKIGAPNATVAMTALTIGDISQSTIGNPQVFVALAHDPVLVAPGAGVKGDGDMLAGGIAGAGYTWTYKQQTATTNFGLGIFSSWTAAKLLAGIYTETFTIDIVATL